MNNLGDLSTIGYSRIWDDWLAAAIGSARMLAYLIEVDDRQLQLRRAFGSMCPWVVAQLRERHAADLSRPPLVELVREAFLLLAPGSSAPR